MRPDASRRHISLRSLIDGVFTCDKRTNASYPVSPGFTENSIMAPASLSDERPWSDGTMCKSNRARPRDATSHGCYKQSRAFLFTVACHVYVFGAVGNGTFRTIG